MPSPPRAGRSSPPVTYNEKGHLGPLPGASLAGPSRSGRKSGLKSRGTQLLAIRFGWVVLVIWYEIGEFFSSLSSCKFPDSTLRRSSSLYARTPPTHVVLLADPHVPHFRLSHPPDGRPWVNFLRQQMEELFMRKSWNIVMRLGRIDVVVMVGDMLDWGRGVMSDQEYDEYVAVFQSIFRLPENVPMYYVPGNHDLPLGPNRLFSPLARERYLRHFSPPNAVLPVSNHSLILLDSIGLVEEDYRRYAAEMQFGEWDGVEGGVIEFVKEVAEEYQDTPKILISHIPLARQEAASCGPLREYGRISKGAGPGYQNLLGSETSRFLLEELRPAVVFSGDDHDYCEHVHPGGIKEVTIKSFSSSAGIRRPGLQLLSLIPPSDYFADPPQITYADRPCFLPDQLGVYYRVYLPLGILTILYLFITNIRSAYARYAATRPNSRPGSPFVHAPGPPNASTTARLGFERSVPLTLPSRRSSQQLAHHTGIGLGMSSGPGPILRTASRAGSTYGAHLQSPQFGSTSAPVSPVISPRPSFSDETFSYYRGDEEANSDLPTPSLSRRSSYVWMNGGSDMGGGRSYPHSEPGSYFSSAPSGHGGGIGLGLSTPTGGVSGLPTPSANGHGYGHNYAGWQRSGGNLSPGQPGHPSRRVTMPRIISPTDWTSAAKAKDKSVIGLLADGLPLPGGGGAGSGVGGGGSRRERRAWHAVKGFARWAWNSRNGVIARSWREVLGVAWPAGITWVLVNLYFFR